jgi:hypothetical protein
MWIPSQAEESSSMTDEDDPHPSTYFHQQLADAPLGGRFAGSRPKINGTEPTVTPLAVPEWCIDPTGIEPPLGYSIEGDAVGGDDGGEDVSTDTDVSNLTSADVPTLTGTETETDLVNASTVGDAFTEAEGMAEDVSSLPSEAMPSMPTLTSTEDEVDIYSPQPTILGTLCLSPEYKHGAEIAARRESFRIITSEE